MKRILLSYGTICIVGLVFLMLHAWWWRQASPDHHAEVVSGFGATLIVLGVLIGSRPYLRIGLRAAAAQGTTFRALVISPNEYGGDFNAATAAAKGKRIAEAMPALIDERVVAVLVVILGTLLNGYGSPLVRVLGL